MNVADPFNLDRAGVRSAFDRAGASYDSAACLQARVGDELLSRLDPFAFTPAVVLDLGAGTGRLSGELKRRYRRAQVIALDLAPGMLQQAARRQRWLRRFERVCADAARLPLRSASVDVVFSNLMLQWLDPPDEALGEVRRVLKPQGFFAFTTFGPDTLRELREVWDEDGHTHVNRFLDMHDVGDALVRCGFTEPVLDVERVTLTYTDALDLMRALKAIGARNVTAGRARALTGKGRLRRMLERYEAYRRDGQLPATYEVIYAVAWSGGHARRSEGMEVRIAPEHIRRRGRS